MFTLILLHIKLLGENAQLILHFWVSDQRLKLEYISWNSVALHLFNASYFFGHLQCVHCSSFVLGLDSFVNFIWLLFFTLLKGSSWTDKMKEFVSSKLQSFLCCIKGSSRPTKNTGYHFLFQQHCMSLFTKIDKTDILLCWHPFHSWENRRLHSCDHFWLRDEERCDSWLHSYLQVDLGGSSRAV